MTNWLLLTRYGSATIERFTVQIEWKFVTRFACELGRVANEWIISDRFLHERKAQFKLNRLTPHTTGDESFYYCIWDALLLFLERTDSFVVNIYSRRSNCFAEFNLMRAVIALFLLYA